jgi:hypothetical protein
LIDYSKIEPVRTKENNTTERASQEAWVLERRSLFQIFTQGCKRFRQPAKKLPSARRRHFCILLLPGKSMASGGTQTADCAFSFSKQKEQQNNDLLLFISDQEARLNFVSSLGCLKGQPFFSLLFPEPIRRRLPRLCRGPSWFHRQTG